MSLAAFDTYAARWYPPWVEAEPLPAGEVSALLALGDALPRETAGISPASGPRLDSGFRHSQVSWIYPGPGAPEVLFRVLEIAQRANAAHFGFDLVGFAEPLQYTVYEAPSVGYEWHVDLVRERGRLQRKLSLTVQLSADDDHEGGELEFREGNGIVRAPRGPGRVVAFASWQLHRVTPVTRGTRRSLVAWVGGPSFR
jgi:PKHD-type hydroxylase